MTEFMPPSQEVATIYLDSFADDYAQAGIGSQSHIIAFRRLAVGEAACLAATTPLPRLPVVALNADISHRLASAATRCARPSLETIRWSERTWHTYLRELHWLVFRHQCLSEGSLPVVERLFMGRYDELLLRQRSNGSTLQGSYRHA